MSIFQYFGQDGAFGEACDEYRSHELPPEVLAEAVALGNPKMIGFKMGYLFASVLKRRGMNISDDDLRTIGCGKFPLGGPEPFIAGFKRFK